MRNFAGLSDNYVMDVSVDELLSETDRQAAQRELLRRGYPSPDKSDPVEHPAHYTQHPSGVECIQITEHMNFCRGNAIKYIWRAGEKGDEIEDLKKARWYLDREIARISTS